MHAGPRLGKAHMLTASQIGYVQRQSVRTAGTRLTPSSKNTLLIDHVFLNGWLYPHIVYMRIIFYPHVVFMRIIVYLHMHYRRIKKMV